ncbi:ABC transporter [Stachybotrys elegans]|uniref:ABC transporter n=1 Tax=Stachybotrys elegans TaxID=80388 RepID=A0A8K0WLM3_9HYPO|nr:ABC transporter [Stachybotrys elegans]
MIVSDLTSGNAQHRLGLQTPKSAPCHKLAQPVRNHISEMCELALENKFGPVVDISCLSGFDFTLLFEESILSILPLGIAGLWALARLWILRNEPQKVYGSWLLKAKLVLHTCYVILLIASLCIVATHPSVNADITLVRRSCLIAVYGMFIILSYQEHLRSTRPSTILCVYLSISLLLDCPYIRTLILLNSNRPLVCLELASVCTKTLLLLLEVTEKRGLIRKGWATASPEGTSGTLNRTMLLWLNGMIYRGFREILSVETLSSLDDEILSASEPSELEKSWKQAQKSDKNMLLKVFLWHYKGTILSGVLPRLARSGFLFSQPFLIERVLGEIGNDGEPHSKSKAHALVGAYAIVYIGLALSYCVYQHKTYRLVTLFRGSLISLIFGKTLVVDLSNVSESEGVTLMSADIDRIGASLPLIHELYASPIEAGIAIWLLYRMFEVSMAAPLAWVIVCLIIGLPIATAAGNAQLPWLEAIERRLEATAMAITSIKTIRLSGLEEHKTQKIESLRVSEIQSSRRHRVLKIYMFVIYLVSSSLAPVWAFGIYVLLHKRSDLTSLDEGFVFAALSLFDLLNQPLVHSIYGFEHLQTVVTCFQRIQHYLVADEIGMRSGHPSTCSSPMIPFEDDPDATTNSFDDFKEDMVSIGNHAARIRGLCARYSPEGAFILNHLTFDLQFDQIAMIHGPVGCGKTTFLKVLLGESGFEAGTCERNFSSTAYCPQSPWIMSGTLRSNITGGSSADIPWYNTVITACALQRDFEELEDGDQTSIGVNGLGLSGGQKSRVSLARAIYSRRQVYILDDPLSGLDGSTEEHILEAIFGLGGLLKTPHATVIMTTSSDKHLRYADTVFSIASNGRVSQDRPVMQYALAEKDMQATRVDKFQDLISVTPRPTNGDVMCNASTHLRHSGDIGSYLFYAKMVQPWLLALYLFSCASYVFGMTFPSIWLQWWMRAHERQDESFGYWLGVYASLAGLTIIGCAIAESVFNLAIIPATAKGFHDMLIRTTMRARTQFFSLNDSGSILNRFSQDLQLVDNDLPLALDRTVFQVLFSLASAVLVFIASGYVAAMIPLCIILLGLIQFYYLRTSRQLRLLDIESKAPLFDLFLEATTGAVSIRAYGWSATFISRHKHALNASQKPYYLLWCIQRWLTLVLDLFNAGLAILLVSIALHVSQSSTGFLGVALYKIVSLGTTLQTLIAQWTQLEMALGAILRIRSYVSLVEDENLPGEDSPLPADWPASGEITVRNVCASYDSSRPDILRNVSFTIMPGEKVAICGRTGSGKSSLLSAIFRLIDLREGCIHIDGLDISTVSRQEIRKRLNCISQDNLGLQGTLRDNVDPLKVASDEQIIGALKAVGMWDLFTSEGLDVSISGDQLSHGQQKLLSLARALVRPSSILLLDEAMSTFDSAAELLMHGILFNSARNCTIISVMHKLQTIHDYDRVLVLDDGKIIEDGTPEELLGQPGSILGAMYSQRVHGKDSTH